MTISLKSKHTLLLLILNILGSCISPEKNGAEGLAARIGDLEIKMQYVDSLISGDLFNLRIIGLKQIINDQLLHLEAKERNISVDKLIETEIIKKSTHPTEDDIREFMMINQSLDWETRVVEKILNEIYQQERKVEYEKYLVKKYKPDFLIFPPHTRLINTTNLVTLNFNSIENENEIIFVFDFDCNHCIDIFDKFSVIANKYNNEASFRLIYLTGSYGLPGRALMAAKRQGLEILFLERMLHSLNNINETGFYLEFIRNSSTNLELFNSDLADKMITKDLMITRDLLFSMGVKATPVFIVNGFLFDHEDMIDYLEPLLIHKFRIKD